MAGRSQAELEQRHYLTLLWDADAATLVDTLVAALDLLELDTRDNDRLGRDVRLAKASAFLLLNRLLPVELADVLEARTMDRPVFGLLEDGPRTSSRQITPRSSSSSSSE